MFEISAKFYDGGRHIISHYDNLSLRLSSPLRMYKITNILCILDNL